MSSSIRRVWRIDRAGSLDRLRCESDDLPPPGGGEARVAVRAIGLNLADVFACLGLYSATPSGPFIPGLEFAGVVEEVNGGEEGKAEGGGREAEDAGCQVGEALLVGSGFSRIVSGDRVLGLTRFGAYATALNVDIRYLRPLPPAWSFAEGAAFPVQALTAWYAIDELARVQEGEAVLVHSGAGGVGLHALGILAQRNAEVVATVGREDKRAFLVNHEGLAGGRVIVRDRRRFASQLDAVLGAGGLAGFDAVLDGVAGPFFRPAFERLRPEGRYVLFGSADLMPAGPRPNYVQLAPRYWRRPRLDPMAMMSANRSLLAFNLIWLWDRVDRLTVMYDRVAQVSAGPPFIGRIFSFEEAPAALRWLQGGESIGKVVLEVPTSSS